MNRPKFSVPKLHAPTFHAPDLSRQGLGLSNHVNYAKYNPTAEESTHGRKSLADLDYSPLRRVTWASFNMAIMVSMGGFIFGYDTGMSCQLQSFSVANCSRSNLWFSGKSSSRSVHSR